MEVHINQEKKSIILDDHLSELGNTLTLHMEEVSSRPKGTKFLATIKMLENGYVKLVWGG